MDADIEALRDQYLNQDFDEKTFEVKAEVTKEYARLCGETASRFLDESDPDFQAPPTFIASLSGRRALPKGFLALALAWMQVKALSVCSRFVLVQPSLAEPTCTTSTRKLAAAVEWCLRYRESNFTMKTATIWRTLIAEL